MYVSRKRLNAAIIWMNCVCMEDRNPPPIIVDLHEIWKNHILRICKLVDPRTVVKQCTNAKECYEIVHRTVLKVEEQRSDEDKGRTNCLSIHAAAKGVEIEIYKYLVLLINQLSFITNKHDVILRYSQQLKDEDLEEEFVSLLKQSKDNCEGDSWWICKRFSDLSDSVEDRLEECIEDNKMLVAKQIVCQQHIQDLERDVKQLNREIERLKINLMENDTESDETEKLLLRVDNLRLKNEIIEMKTEIRLKEQAEKENVQALKTQLDNCFNKIRALLNLITTADQDMKKDLEENSSFSFFENMFSVVVVLVISAVTMYYFTKSSSVSNTF